MDIQKIRNIHPREPQPGLINEAAAIIRRGGVVGFPTRCLYGLGADALNPEAVDRIFELKQRPADNPILVLIDHISQLEKLVKRIPALATDLVDKFWPGKITLVFEAAEKLPVNLTAGSGKIGVRMPGHAAARALVNAVQAPITGTSANLSGKPGCHRINDLEPQIARGLDLILDAGDLKGGAGSTVVDVSTNRLQIIREGAVPAQELNLLL
ncbi:MAG: threonylcarbamoyl-AMP synthase [Deltaproteobacteria bacterium]|jgi:L-threonylcarbamoyladenylate synthase|nr:threonylcarbamoyl-AMP synthase [Deltaproteobacteria bacterium]